MLSSSTHVASAGLHVNTFGVACCTSVACGLLGVAFKVLASAKEAGLSAWISGGTGGGRTLRHIVGAGTTGPRLRSSQKLPYMQRNRHDQDAARGYEAQKYSV